MRIKWHRLLMLLVVAMLAFAAAGCGGDDDDEAGDGATTEATADEGGGTLVFGTSQDPVVLDGALVSDGESLRAIDQMFEGLVTLSTGGTDLEPGLAESWEVSEDGLTYTFSLREGVTFHDGEPFNAEAVCFNFDRWYNFPAALQSPSASYYWQNVLGGGFADPAEGAPGPDDSTYASCEAPDETTAILTLNKRSASFLGSLALSNFTIASPKALQEFGADEGTVDEETGFRPTGTYGTENPVGTGPFQFESWTRGERLVMTRFDDYWGDKAKIEELIFRPISDNAARLQALQSGEIQGYDLVEPQDMETIEGDENLQILDRPAFNVGYVGITQSHEPLDQLEVRQAIAHGLNREEVVDSFYAGRGEVAHQFQPPDLWGYADDVTQYEFDSARAQELLQEAGVATPLELTFCYPTDVARPYMPDPARNFQAFAASLNESGFRITPRAMPWSPDYLGAVSEGNCPLYILGWTGDIADPDNFLGTFFQSPDPAWGFDNQELFDLLDNAETPTEQDERAGIYEDAARVIADFIPGVPYVHTQPALAFAACVEGYEPSPVSLEPFSIVSLEGC